MSFVPLLQTVHHNITTCLLNVLQMIKDHSEEESEGPMQLEDDDEEDLSRVWDMTMDKVKFPLTFVPYASQSLFTNAFLYHGTLSCVV